MSGENIQQAFARILDQEGRILAGPFLARPIWHRSKEYKQQKET